MALAEYYTDPACPWSWALEPSVRKLMLQFGERLRWQFVMGGLALDLRDALSAPQARGRLIEEWLRVADRTGAPLDPLVWVEGPIETTYPACMAVKAAAEQESDGGYRYLRRLREGLMCERRKLDHVEALVEQARAASLDVERFRLGLRSHAITEAFGEDLERAKRLGAEIPPPTAAAGAFTSHSMGAGGAPLPTLVFRGEDGGEQRVLGYVDYPPLNEAATAACGGMPDMPAPSVQEAIARFGRVTTAEVEALCELPGPRAGAELFRLAEAWKVRPVKTLTGYLWEAA
jgi:protein-disulfide isomerase-like protein with CxxC motif